MSVIVKDILFPSGCSNCALLQTDYDVTEYWCAVNSYIKFIESVDIFDYRPDDCPLVEIKEEEQ